MLLIAYWTSKFVCSLASLCFFYVKLERSSTQVGLEGAIFETSQPPVGGSVSELWILFALAPVVSVSFVMGHQTLLVDRLGPICGPSCQLWAVSSVENSVQSQVGSIDRASISATYPLLILVETIRQFS